MQALIIFAIVIAVATANEKIVGGDDVSPVGKYPWQASLEYLGSHSCGASLISSRWLVCAAHCVGGAVGSYRIVLGMHDRVTRNQGDPTTYSVTQIVRHPNYDANGSGYPNDLSLIQLTSNANTGSAYIKTVPMANTDETFFGQTCVISGWGRTSGSSSSLPNVLQETNVVALTATQCRSTWGNVINANYHLCVQGSGSGACNGDSGGPLVCRRGTTWVLAGATSWGQSSCNTAFPSVYTNVEYYRDWIRSVTGV